MSNPAVSLPAQASGLGHRWLRIDPRKQLLAVLTVIVAAIVLVPLLFLLRTSFLSDMLGRFSFSALGFHNYIAAFDGTGPLIWNTIVFALGSATIGISLGLVLAWLTERTDLPGRVPLRIMMFSWMAVPPIVFGYGWILALNRSNGILNKALEGLTGRAGPFFDPYNFVTLVVVAGIGLVPTSFIMLGGVLRNMDPAYEDAARLSGASSWTILRRISLPLMTPGLLSASLFLFVAMMQTFDLPFIFGLTGRIPFLSTKIYLLALPDSGTPDFGLAAAFGVVLCVIAAALLVAYFRAVRLGERFQVVTGKGFKPRRQPLGAWKLPILAAVIGFVLIMALPIVILTYASLLPFYRVPSIEQLSVISLANYVRIFSDSLVQRAIGNTILLMLFAATAVMTLAFITAWFVARMPHWLTRVLDMLIFASMAVPPIVMAVALLVVYVGTPLYGTLLLIGIGHIGIYLAFGTRTMTGALSQLHRDLENAGATSGAGLFSILRKIVFPLVMPQAVAGWLWVAAHSARDLTVPLVLMTADNVVASSATRTIWDYPDLPMAAALSVVMVLILLCLVVPLEIWLLRRGAASSQFRTK